MLALVVKQCDHTSMPMSAIALWVQAAVLPLKAGMLPGKHLTSLHLTADLLTGADLDGDEDADSDLSHSDESADGDSMGAGSDALDDEEQEDENAATDDIVTAKGNHKRREDKKLLPTEDKCVALSLS